MRVKMVENLKVVGRKSDDARGCVRKRGELEGVFVGRLFTDTWAGRDVLNLFGKLGTGGSTGVVRYRNFLWSKVFAGDWDFSIQMFFAIKLGLSTKVRGS